MWPCRTLVFAHHPHPNPKGWSKIIELCFTLTPKCEGPKCNCTSSLSSQGLARDEGVEVSLPGQDSIPWYLQADDPGRARDISRSRFSSRLSILGMSGLLHHHLVIHTIPTIIYSIAVLKCCKIILMISAWPGSTSWDSLCWTFELEHLSLILSSCTLLLTAKHGGSTPPSIGGSTWDTTNSN